MARLRVRLWARLLGGLGVLASLWCCGGGSTTAPPAPTPVAVRFDVAWAARSREPLPGPSSALSVTVRLVGAQADGTDVTAQVDRATDPAAYTGSYTTTPAQALPGTWPLQATFQAQAGGGGDTVGTAAATVTIAADGTGLGTIATSGTVTAVEVAAGQALLVGERRVLTATVRDGAGNLLAVTPGSFFWALTSGAALRFDADTAEGLAAGTAEVTATVDGQTSAAQAVTVAALPGGLPFDHATTQALDVPPGGEVTPQEGLVLAFPAGAGGTLATARLTSRDGVPVTGGQGFQVASSTNAPVEVKLPKVDGRDGRVLLRTPAGGVWDYATRPAYDWLDLPARDPGDGYLYFALPRQTAPARGIADYVDTFWSVTVDPPPHAGTVRNKIIIYVGKILDQLTGPLATHYAARYASPGFRLYFRDPSLGSYFWVTTAFGPTIYLTTDASDTIIAHETSHYATYLLTDNAGWTAYESGAEQAHTIGDVWGREHVLTDDYAYFIQQYTGLPENGGGSTEPGSFALLVRKAPHEIDYPSLEAFASVLMTSLTWTTTPQLDFARTRSPVPTPAMPVSDLMQIIADQAMTLNALRDKLAALLAAKGQPAEVLQVIAERCGWSYRAKGTLQYQTGAAIAGATVQSVVKYGGQEYVAGSTTTGADGSFTLARVFPGDHWLRAIIGGAPRDLSLSNPWARSTTFEIDLGTVNAGLPSILDKLQAGTTTVKTAVYCVLPGGGFEISFPDLAPGDWTSGQAFVMRRTETGSSGGCTGQVNRLAEATFSADGQTLTSIHTQRLINSDCSPTYTSVTNNETTVTAIPYVGSQANGPSWTDYVYRLESPDVASHAGTVTETITKTYLVPPFNTVSAVKVPSDFGGVKRIEVTFTCPN